MMKKAGYEIVINKILEFKHKAIFKNYIEYLYSKKKRIFVTKEKVYGIVF